MDIDAAFQSACDDVAANMPSVMVKEAVMSKRKDSLATFLREQVFARLVAAGFSTPKIGQTMGGHSHSTVVVAMRRLRRLAAMEAVEATKGKGE